MATSRCTNGQMDALAASGAMAEVRHCGFVNGVMFAEAHTPHTEAVAEVKRALVGDGIVNIPDGTHARLGWANGGSWFTVDYENHHCVSTVHAGDETLKTITELIALSVADGGYVNASALSQALQMAPIVVTICNGDGSDKMKKCIDIASWVGFVKIGADDE